VMVEMVVAYGYHISFGSSLSYPLSAINYSFKFQWMRWQAETVWTEGNPSV